MGKILTIVVPVYNTERYLSKCLNSLIVDKFLNNIEVLIVIDGSPDNSITIAKEFCERYPETFFVINKENGGHGSTINEGLKVAKGKYFRVLDSDDWFNTKNFEVFLNNLLREDNDLILTHLVKEYVSENLSIRWSDGDLRINYFSPYTDMSILDTLPNVFFGMGRCTYKTSKLREHNLHLLEKRSFEDTMLHVFPMLFLQSFVFYDLDLYHYFLERPGQSVNQSVTIKQAKCWRDVIEQMLSIYIQSESFMPQSNKKFFLRVLKYYINIYYVIANKLKYREAALELKTYNKLVKNCLVFKDVQGLKCRLYNIMPYPLYRTLASIYYRLRLLS